MRRAAPAVNGAGGVRARHERTTPTRQEPVLALAGRSRDPWRSGGQAHRHPCRLGLPGRRARLQGQARGALSVPRLFHARPSARPPARPRSRSTGRSRPKSIAASCRSRASRTDGSRSTATASRSNGRSRCAASTRARRSIIWRSGPDRRGARRRARPHRRGGARARRRGRCRAMDRRARPTTSTSMPRRFGETPDLFPAAEVDALARASRAAYARIRPLLRRARPRRPRPAHPRRSASRQYRADRRPAGAVRRHRVQPADRLGRRALRSRLPADGSDRARAGAAPRTSCSTAISPRHGAPRISTRSRRCRSICRCARRSAPRSRRRGCESADDREDKPRSRASRATYFDFARQAIAPPAPRLIAVGGLSGTGKVGARARAGARSRRRCPAPWCCAPTSSARRCSATTRPTSCRPTPTRRRSRRASTPRSPTRRAASAAPAIRRSSMPCSHSRRSARRWRRSAERAGRPLPRAVPRPPISPRASRASGARSGDASDADAAVARAQESYDLGALDWTRIDASGTPEQTLARAHAALERLGEIGVIRYAPARSGAALIVIAL